MSKRESIAANIVSTLQAMSTPVSASYVTREPFAFDKLSNAQFPALLIQSARENREDSTIGGSNILRTATVDYDIVGYVKALDTQIVAIETDEGAIDPIGGVIVTVRVLYNFTRGAS